MPESIKKEEPYMIFKQTDSGAEVDWKRTAEHLQAVVELQKKELFSIRSEPPTKREQELYQQVFQLKNQVRSLENDRGSVLVHAGRHDGPRATLEFPLPEARNEFNMALRGARYFAVLCEFAEVLRRAYKDDRSQPSWIEVRNIFYGVLNDEGVILDEVD